MNINIHCIRYHFLNIFTGVIQSSLISVSNQKGALRSTSFVFHDRFGAANQNSVRAGGARLFPRRKTTSFGQCLRCFLIALLVSALITRGAVLRRLPKSCYTVDGSHHFPRERDREIWVPHVFTRACNGWNVCDFVCCGSVPWSKLSKHMYYLTGFDVSKSDIIFVGCKNVLSDISRIASILNDTLIMRCCSKLFAYSSDFSKSCPHREQRAPQVHCPPHIRLVTDTCIRMNAVLYRHCENTLAFCIYRSAIRGSSGDSIEG